MVVDRHWRAAHATRPCARPVDPQYLPPTGSLQGWVPTAPVVFLQPAAAHPFKSLLDAGDRHRSARELAAWRARKDLACDLRSVVPAGARKLVDRGPETAPTPIAVALGSDLAKQVERL